MRRWLRRISTSQWADVVAILLLLYVVIWALHPSLLFSNSTTTGGDTGAHIALPAYLRDHLGATMHLTSWYPGWFDGMPLYTYYFVLPDLIAALLSYVISYAVAFKLATILGSLLIPFAAYVMGRCFRAPRPIPVALAAATLPFLFDPTFTIDGGNLFSTLAGEYSFSLSLAFALLTIGLTARALREGRHRLSAAVLLSLTLAAHVLPWFFALVAIGVLVQMELIARTRNAAAYDATTRLRPKRQWIVRCVLRVGVPVTAASFTLVRSANHRSGLPSMLALGLAFVLAEWGPSVSRRAPRHRGVRRRLSWFAAGIGALSLGLSAWWLVPFGLTQSMTNSMGYVNNSVATFRDIFSHLGWYASSGQAGGDRVVIVLAALAFLWAVASRNRLGLLLTSLALLSLVGYIVDPQSAIWNERLVPFWYVSIYLSAGWLVGTVVQLVLQWVGNRRDVRYYQKLARQLEESVEPVGEGEALPDRPRRPVFWSTLAISLCAIAVVMAPMLPSVASTFGITPNANQVPSWAAWNYSGYEGKASWPEYHDVITTMSRTARQYGCGQAMWEYSPDESRFGTTMGLMLLPYWTHNCVGSMEGLLFESSATTPYHFLNQAELSLLPSNPMVGLAYGSLDLNLGIDHLQMMGVKYYLAYSPTVVALAAVNPNLREVAVTRAHPVTVTGASGATQLRWHVYEVAQSHVVEGLRTLPNVNPALASRTAWVRANASWWNDPQQWPTMFATSGPASWPRTHGVVTRIAAPPIVITNVHESDQAIRFHVDRLGVPVLVKISYYPRWRVTGGTGPYRVSPNFMVVVPTRHDVSLTYGSSSALTFGNDVTNVTVLGVVVVLWRRRPWRRPRTGR